MMRFGGLALALVLSVGCQPADTPAPNIGDDDKRAAITVDVNQICDFVPQQYPYFAMREANWDVACDQARAAVSKAKTGAERLGVIETLIDALYDPHTSLNTNSNESPRLVPSGADYWLVQNEVTDVRAGGSAAKAGLRVGDRVIKVNGQSLTEAATARVQPEGVVANAQQMAWAINVAAAGYRDEARSVTVVREGGEVTLELGEPAPQWPGRSASFERIGDVLHVRLHNSLGDDGAGAAVLAGLREHLDVRAVILDLRDTPGGGNTGNAEPIMGAFFDAPIGYQKVMPKDKAPYVRQLTTISSEFADVPLVVLVGRWTGSMGEGMAVGFDGTERAAVMGSRMAGLAGGIEPIKLEGTGINFRMPTYDLQHIDGTPRHEWTPPVSIIADNGAGPDLALAAALEYLAQP